MDDQKREAQRQYHREYRRKNKERLKAQSHEYYLKNKERIKAKTTAYYYDNWAKCREARRTYAEKTKDEAYERQKAYQVKNKERLKAYHKAYRAANADGLKEKKKLSYERTKQAYLLRAMQRKARKRAAPGTCTKAQLDARIAFYGNKCAYCPGPFEHVDHVIPLSRGGSNWPANLRPACAKCNLSKSDMSAREWLASLTSSSDSGNRPASLQGTFASS